MRWQSRLGKLSACAAFVAALFAPETPAAPVNWVPAADGLWGNAANWNPGLPGPADDVTIDVGGGTVITVTFASPTIATVNTIASQENLLVQGGTLTVVGNYTNTAATTQTGGTFSLGGVSSLATLSLSGGILQGIGAVTVAGPSSWTSGIMSNTGTSTFNGALGITGDANKFLSGGRTLNTAGTTTWSGNTQDNSNEIVFSGSSRINNSGTWLDQNAFTVSLLSASGTNVFTNTGTYTKSGAGETQVSVVFNNPGTVNVNAGRLNVRTGIQGPTGTINIGTNGALTLGAASSVGTLNHGGGGATSLALENNSITIHTDYTNANFGVGDAFNRRANVTTTGIGNRLLAAGDVNQGVAGANVNSGNTPVPTLTIGNVRVGATTSTYDIANTGTSGPALRGAIQTGVNGGNITDARLSGTGVTAGNWGPIGPGGSLARDVTVTINTAGVYAPITGQAVNILNNFENTRSQLLSIQSANGAAAYNPAAGAATPTPIVLANQREGGTSSPVLTITNTAPAGPFSEGLKASFGPNSGDALNNGGAIDLLAAGASNSSAMAVRLNTTTAGAKTGSVLINYVSDGAGTSGLAPISVGSQSINISGNVFRLAQGQAASPVNLGNFRVGNSVSGALSVTNTAAADGFSEVLNANVSGTGGAVSSTTGSVTLLNPGATSNAISATIGSGIAGLNSGTVTLAYQSDGTGTTGAVPIGVGSQTIAVQATGWNVATGNATPTPVNLGNFHVGGAAPASQNLAVANQAPAAFSEQLGIQSVGATGPFTATNNLGSGRVSGGANAANAVTVGMGAGGAAGVNSGTVSIQYLSDGTAPGNSGFAPINSNLQNVSVSATGYRLATYNLGTLDFGSVLVGSGLTSRVLSVANTQIADGFSEGLNASFGTLTNNGAGVLTDISTAITNLLAGQVDTSSLRVQLNPTSQGAINGQIQVILASNGATTSGLGITALGTESILISGTITGQAGVLAIGDLTPTAVNAGNVRIGTSVTQALAVSNIAAAPAEGLNASFGANTGNVSNNGGLIASLAAGGTNNTNMIVSLDTSVAGARSGSATVNYVSDGSFNGGVTTPVGSQAVSMQANVYRLANPVVNPPPVALAARVGDPSPNTGVSVTNSSPDAFTEGLKASISTAAPGFSATGAIVNLAAGATDPSTLRVGLNTGTAGTFSGQAALAFASTGAGTTGAADLALPIQNVTLSGKVYTPAVANVANTPVDFGIVHVGDLNVAKALTVSNAAPVTALNDVLRGSLGGATGPFSAGGTLGAGLAAGQTNSSSLTVGLSTAAAGVFNGTAGASFVSHNEDLADLPLPGVGITLLAQVNNFANPIFGKSSGAGAFGGSGLAFDLNFGNLVLDSGLVRATLFVQNDVLGPADLLAGLFDFEFGPLQDFGFAGFVPFEALAAGETLGGLMVTFDPRALGSFDDLVLLEAEGHNASGYRAGFPDITLRIRGTVVDSAQVPEPASIALVSLALAALLALRQRRREVERGS